MKSLVLFVSLTALPLLANASFQCDISARSAITHSQLGSESSLENASVAQLNAAESVDECVEKAISLLKEKCKQHYGGNAVGAFVNYSNTNSLDYTTDAVIEGYCAPATLMTYMGYAKSGFKENSRIGFLRKK
ncbi:MAG: hypothetical protein KDD37_00350 [Bdellovibrionales bacterium]|nr:hypothetical protein [Bdellovibrionales bacterium]